MLTEVLGSRRALLGAQQLVLRKADDRRDANLLSDSTSALPGGNAPRSDSAAFLKGPLDLLHRHRWGPHGIWQCRVGCRCLALYNVPDDFPPVNCACSVQELLLKQVAMVLGR